MSHAQDRPAIAMKTIGIIGGSTDVATAEYYKIINAETNRRIGGHHTAEIIINSMNFAMSAYYVNNALWEEGGRYLRGKALSLERAGADFVLCVSNTWHRVADMFMEGIGIPFLHIVDPTAEAIHAAGLRRVALLGTKPVKSMPFLKTDYERRSIAIVVPEEDEQNFIDRIIFDELSKAKFTHEAKQGYLDIVDRLQDRGAEGIILGCTEIPFLISQKDRPGLPMFDTLDLHAKAAVELALR
jgi:aspartate racemase